MHRAFEYHSDRVHPQMIEPFFFKSLALLSDLPVTISSLQRFQEMVISALDHIFLVMFVQGRHPLESHSLVLNISVTAAYFQPFVSSDPPYYPSNDR